MGFWCPLAGGTGDTGGTQSSAMDGTGVPWLVALRTLSLSQGCSLLTGSLGTGRDTRDRSGAPDCPAGGPRATSLVSPLVAASPLVTGTLIHSRGDELQ